MLHVVLYSGGPDSLITYHRICKEMSPEDEIISMYFDLGHRYARQEQLAIIRTVPGTFFEVGLTGLGNWEEEDAYIHHRNAFLILGAAKYIPKISNLACQDGIIWLTVQKDEMSIPDRDPLFFLKIEEVLLKLGQRIRVKTLWEEYDKTDMVNWYRTHEGDIDTLKKTWSCYKPQNSTDQIHCGECAACFRRAIAFELNGISESYAKDPFKGETAALYKLRAKTKYYSEERCQRILQALK